MDRFIEWFLKLLFLIILLPAIIGIILQLAGSLLAAVLPWVLAIAFLALLVIGALAVLSHGKLFALSLRNSPSRENFPPPVDAVKRSRPLRDRTRES